MVSSINLGSLYTSGGKQVFGGSASGLDTENLVNSLIEAKSIPKTKIEDQVSLNTNKIVAYSGLEQRLATFRTALDGLRNPPGIQNSSQNFFEYRTATLETDSFSSGESFLTAVAKPGAVTGSNEVTVTALASERVLAFSSPFASRSDAIVAANGDATAGTISAGTITLQTTTGPAVNISIEEDDSLNDLVARINQKKSESGVEATVLKVSDTDYRLSLKSTQTGLDNSFTITDPDGVFTELTTDATASKAAANAELTINGIPIERQSNNITDAIDNVEINLKQLTAGTTVTINVNADEEFLTQGITNFVNAYNELKIYIAKQTERDEEGNTVEGAYLNNSSTLNTAMNRINNELTSLVKGITGTNPKSIQEIGITFSDFEGDDETPEISNVLSFDIVKFSSAVANGFDQVRNIFEFSMTSDNTNLSVFKRTNELNVSEFNLEVDTVLKTAVARDVDTNEIIGEFTYDDSTGSVFLTGEEGTAIAGLQLIYSSSTSDTMNVTLTQGIADRVFNAVDGVLADGGILKTEVESLTSNNERLNTEIFDLQAEIERYRESLLEKFSSLERMISSVNQLLASLEAQANARNNS